MNEDVETYDGVHNVELICEQHEFTIYAGEHQHVFQRNQSQFWYRPCDQCSGPTRNDAKWIVIRRAVPLNG